MKSSVVSLIKLCCLCERKRGERKKEKLTFLSLIQLERDRQEKQKDLIILVPEQARTVLIVFLAYSKACMREKNHLRKILD